MGKIRMQAHKLPEDDIDTHEEDFEQASVELLYDIGHFLAEILEKLDQVIKEIRIAKDR